MWNSSVVWPRISLVVVVFFCFGILRYVCIYAVGCWLWTPKSDKCQSDITTRRALSAEHPSQLIVSCKTASKWHVSFDRKLSTRGLRGNIFADSRTSMGNCYYCFMDGAMVAPCTILCSNIIIWSNQFIWPRSKLAWQRFSIAINTRHYFGYAHRDWSANM